MYMYMYIDLACNGEFRLDLNAVHSMFPCKPGTLLVHQAYSYKDCYLAN